MEFPLAEAEIVAEARGRGVMITDVEGNRRLLARADEVTTVDGATGLVVSATLNTSEELRIIGNAKSRLADNTKDFFVGPSRIRYVSAGRHLCFRDDEQRELFIAKLYERCGFDPVGDIPEDARRKIELYVLRSIELAIMNDEDAGRIGDFLSVSDPVFVTVTQALIEAKDSERALATWIVSPPSRTDESASKDPPGLADHQQSMAVREVLAKAAGYDRIPSAPEYRAHVRAHGRRHEATISETVLWELRAAIEKMPFARDAARASDWEHDDDPDPLSEISPLGTDHVMTIAWLVSRLDHRDAKLVFSLFGSLRRGPTAVAAWLQKQRGPSGGTRRIIKR